jgi:hypothetical protein
MPRPTLRAINNQTGAIGTKSHKCKECNNPTTKKCLDNGHVAFCTALLDPSNPSSQVCGVRFNVISPGGCMKHPYNGGHNLEAVMARGKYPGYKIPYDLQLQLDAKAKKEKEEQKAREEEEARLAARPHDADWSKVDGRHREKSQGARTTLNKIKKAEKKRDGAP